MPAEVPGAGVGTGATTCPMLKLAGQGDGANGNILLDSRVVNVVIIRALVAASCERLRMSLHAVCRVGQFVTRPRAKRDLTM